MKVVSSSYLEILPAWDQHNPSSRLQAPWTNKKMLTQTANRNVSWFTSQAPFLHLQLYEKRLQYNP